jgi:hypothetical protein
MASDKPTRSSPAPRDTMKVQRQQTHGRAGHMPMVRPLEHAPTGRDATRLGITVGQVGYASPRPLEHCPFGIAAPTRCTHFFQTAILRGFGQQTSSDWSGRDG